MAEMAWQCDCGHVEYSLSPPQECEECYKLDSFIQLQTEKEITDFDDEEMFETPIKLAKKATKAKSNSKTKSVRGGKKKK